VEKKGLRRVVKEFNATATMVSGKHATAEYNYKQYVREDVPDKASASRTATMPLTTIFIPRERKAMRRLARRRQEA